jgi:predicted porin
MKFAQISILAAALAGPIAHAQWEDDWNPWETETDFGAALAIMPEADEEMLARAWAGISTNRVLDSGLEIGVAGRLELQKDHSQRAGFSGVPVSTDGTGPGLQGAFTGLAVGVPARDADARAEIETAYAYVEGGYGQLRLGRDLGVAARFQENAPSVFTTLASGRQSLDPTSLDMVTTRHDLTGPSAKLTYTTPRLVGVRAGLSFTPKADVRGLDRDADRNLPGAAPVTLTNAVEGAVNVSRLVRSEGVRLSAALSASTAEVDTPPYASALYERVSTWSLGANAEFETVSIGATWLNSDNGIAAGGDYESWTIGLSKSVGAYVLGAEYGHATDSLTKLEGDAWKLGVSRNVTNYAKLTLGYAENSLKSASFSDQMRQSGKNSPEGIVIEITLSN